MNKEEIIKGALFAEFLNQNGVETGVDVDEILDKITGETMEEKSNECMECAVISTKRMYLMLSKAEEKLLQNTIDKKEIFSLLSSVKHDILLMEDKDNQIECDLFK